MYHSSNSHYGENLFSYFSSEMSPNQQVDGRQPVEMWYAEIKDYKGSFSMNSGELFNYLTLYSYFIIVFINPQSNWLIAMGCSLIVLIVLVRLVPNCVNCLGHFTQVIWKSSSRLGVGYARSRGGTVYVVANYDPPGNFQGKFQTDVLPLKNWLNDTPKRTFHRLRNRQKYSLSSSVCSISCSKLVQYL